MTVTATLAVLTACSLPSDGEGDGSGAGNDVEQYATTFDRIGPQGYIDMSLDFANPTDQPVILKGRLVARDAQGAELPDVRVTTAFRTPLAGAVVMPGGTTDFVQLDGPGESKVRDITLEDGTAFPAKLPVATQLVDLVAIGGDGSELEYDALARQVRLDNPNTVDVRVRVVLLVLGAPQDGVPQEAVLVHDVTTVDIGANQSVTLDLDPGTRRILRERGFDSFVTLRTVFAL